jgi:hypothetical protein
MKYWLYFSLPEAPANVGADNVMSAFAKIKAMAALSDKL